MNAVANPRPRFEHRFYVGAVVAAFAMVFAGFARPYYLRASFGGPALPLLLHLHGALTTSWFALFFTQTCLIDSHRIAWHRRLGIVGAVLALLLVAVGITTVMRFASRYVHSPIDGPVALSILGFSLVVLALFLLFVGTAIVLRRRPDFHKRLMLLATLSLLPPAIVRIPIDFIWDRNSVSFLLTDLCVIVAVVIETTRNRRLHPVFAWGTLLIIASTWLAYIAVQTQAWMHFATWLVS
jgi:uncharacterized membrane protein YozB (DUF420 family)